MNWLNFSQVLLTFIVCLHGSLAQYYTSSWFRGGTPGASYRPNSSRYYSGLSYVPNGWYQWMHYWNSRQGTQNGNPFTQRVPYSGFRLWNYPRQLIAQTKQQVNGAHNPQVAYQYPVLLSPPQLTRTVNNPGPPQVFRTVNNPGPPQVFRTVNNPGPPQIFRTVNNPGSPPQVPWTVNNPGSQQVPRTVNNPGHPGSQQVPWTVNNPGSSSLETRLFTRFKESSLKSSRLCNPGPPLPESRRFKNCLVIGDSIAIGYMPAVRSELGGLCQVQHAPFTRGSGAVDSRLGVKCLRYLLTTTDMQPIKYDAIIFNFGMHDIDYNQQFPEEFVSLEDYRNNLKKLKAAFLKTGAKVAFALTTPFPSDPQKNRRVIEVNQVAQGVMKSGHRVPVIDLYNVIVQKCGQPPYSKCPIMKRPKDVHFNKEGYEILGKRVAAVFKLLLAKTPPKQVLTKFKRGFTGLFYPPPFGSTVCPDTLTRCPAGSTCCPSVFSLTGFGCCVMPNAVHCQDKWHCCPMGSLCSSSCNFARCKCVQFVLTAHGQMTRYENEAARKILPGSTIMRPGHPVPNSNRDPTKQNSVFDGARSQSSNTVPSYMLGSDTHVQSEAAGNGREGSMSQSPETSLNEELESLILHRHPIMRKEKPEHGSHVSDENATRPGFQGKGETGRPGLHGDGKTRRPGLHGDGKTSRPGLKGDGKTIRPGLHGDGKTRRPGLHGDGKTSRPGLKGDGKTRRPGPQGDGKTRRPGLQRDRKRMRPGPQSNEETRRPGFQGYGKTKRPVLESDGKAMRPGLKGMQKMRRPGYQGDGKTKRPVLESDGKARRPGLKGVRKMRRPGFQGDGKTRRPGLGSYRKTRRPGLGGVENIRRAGTIREDTRGAGYDSHDVTRGSALYGVSRNKKQNRHELSRRKHYKVTPETPLKSLKVHSKINDTPKTKTPSSELIRGEKNVPEMKQSGGKKVTNVNVYGYSSGETSGDGPENLREVLPTGSGHAIHVENFNYVIVTDRRKILDDSEEGSASVTLGNSDTTAGMHDTSLAGRSVTGKIRDGNGAKDAGRVNQWEDALLVGNMNDRPKTISFSAEVPEISGDQPYKETGSADFASGSGSLDKGVSWISANLRNESTLLSSKIPVPEITESIDFASGSIREVPSSTENKGNKNKILEKNDQGKMINGSKVFESGSGSTDVGITGNQNEVISASDVRATGNSGFESGSGSGNVHEINDSWKIHESQTNGTRARASPFLKTGKGSGNDARKIPIPLSHVKKAYSHQSGEDDNETNYADVNFDNLMGEADGSAVEQEDDIMTGVWAASGVLQSPLDNIADDQTVIHGTESRKESGTSKTGSTEHMAFVPGSGKSKPKKNLLSPGFESLARYLSLPENPISTRKTGFEVTNELWQQQPVQSGLAESLKTYNATLQSSMNISSKGPNEANNVDNPAIDNGTRTESESPKDVTTAKPAAKALTGTGSMPFDYSENSMESEDTSSDDLMFDNTGGGGLL